MFIDSTVQPGKRYMYYVLVEAGGQVSDQSNLVTFPLLTPPMTFAQLLREVDRLDQRHRLLSPRITRVRQQIVDAQTFAAKCKINAALRTLRPQTASSAVLEPEATDLEIRMAKLLRRLQVFNRLPHEVSSDEFCTYREGAAAEMYEMRHQGAN
jgi:hypothetical protein